MNDINRVQRHDELMAEARAQLEQIEAEFEAKREQYIQEVINDPEMPYSDREGANGYLEVELDWMKQTLQYSELTFNSGDDTKAQIRKAIQEAGKAMETNHWKVAAFLKKAFDIRYNVVTGLEMKDPITNSSKWKPINDRFDNAIHYFAVDYFEVKSDENIQSKDISKSAINNIILSHHFEEYDPFIEYFEELPVWNGKDYIKQIADLVKVEKEDPKMWDDYFKRWFVGMVAQMRNEAERGNQLMLILVGPGGKGKTYWLMSLAIEEMYGVSKSNLGLETKDGEIVQTENQIVVLDEAEDTFQKQMSIVKSLITSKNTKVRLPYGKRVTNLARRATYCGTSNYRNILKDKDDSGNRRFLPFWVEEIKGEPNDELKRNAYAQAYALLKSEPSFQYWTDEEEGQKIVERNKRFMVGNGHIPRDNSVESISNEQAIHNIFTAATKNTEGAEHFTPTRALEVLKERYPEVSFKTVEEFGSSMSNILPDAEKKNKKYDGKSCMGYWVILN